MGVGEAVRVAVSEAVGVAVGGKTICVTKLHANRDKTKNPKTIRFIFIYYLNTKSRVLQMLAALSNDFARSK